MLCAPIRSVSFGALQTNGSAPQQLRLRLLDATPRDAVRLAIAVARRQRLDVFVDGVWVRPANELASPPPDGVLRPQAAGFTPLPGGAAGANYFERATNTLFVVLRGAQVLELATAPVVAVQLVLATELRLLNVAMLAAKVAAALNLPASHCSISDVRRVQAPPPPRSFYMCDAKDRATVSLTNSTPRNFTTDPRVYRQVSCCSYWYSRWCSS